MSQAVKIQISLTPRVLMAALFVVLTALYFLSLGSDTASQYYLRLALTGILGMTLVLSFVRGSLKVRFLTPLFLFGLFVGYQWLRFGVAFAVSHLNPEAGMAAVFVKQYFLGAVDWTALFLLCVFSCRFAEDQTQGFLFSRVCSWMGFLLALSAVPALLDHGRPFYQGPHGRGFFPPVLYAISWVNQFVLGRYAHPNYTGDVIAFGFFAALGTLVYGLFKLRDQMRSGSSSSVPRAEGQAAFSASLALSGMMVMVTAAAIFLLFSRGSIATFIGAAAVFFVLLLVKYPSKYVGFVGAGILAAGILFLAWAGNLQQAWQEVRTLNREIESVQSTSPENPGAGSSFDANREGARRSWAIFQDYPLWGVGRGGYSILARQYASGKPNTGGNIPLIDYESMCHYLHILAEEGSGSLLYFLFLAAYFASCLRSFMKVRSRYQFVTGLAWFAPVVMVLVHAAINHLLQRFAMSALLYIFMGASLGVLSKDFKRRSENRLADSAHAS